MAFNFNGRETSLRYVSNRPELNTDIGYSFFMMFRIKPPTYDPSHDTGIYLFRKVKSNNTITWRWHGGSAEGTGIIVNSTEHSWITGIFETFGRNNDASNLEPRWYSLGISSISPLKSIIYLNGTRIIKRTRGLEADFRDGMLLIGHPNRGKMDSQVSVCYEWYSALSDEEQASLA
ncbi:MAG: hypothetical protein KZQ66_12930 [Candidatus Thiodiazotropha sp. (ex Lucinoma aequizonata)]|nr:hypothetical protein [Candidatus Thiodiazotropha sp. (ex Lucinoma aequizonata)]MCU7888322.1 hypothetical protein [Candidatus Thiodiazotropha sp. (ex Lucinoma aequizonata)]MCU7898932.1 hypothetical protein [Candidatus Thiodiazotropha sp. (ex Lucinoma aequizonata)]MCU7902786.1 hypothetical protein [Candidatus Thiodiazotropha sp. (ex Lucinoma aequizonata)]MCU7909525.1 hypothetical protein [Candidatus Thiodiazotropha sp. (ex Lucinoma aequizonata)]